MKRVISIITFIFLATLTLPVCGEEYKSKAQRILEEELAIRAELAAKRENSQTTTQISTQFFKSESKISDKGEKLGTYPSKANLKPQRIIVPKFTRSVVSQTKTQTLQGMFQNADWGSGVYHYTPAETGSKENPSGSRFWKAMKVIGGVALGYVAIKSISDGDFGYYSGSPLYPSQPLLYDQQQYEQSVSTQSTGKNLSMLSNQQSHTYSVGDHLYGNVGNQQIHMYNIGDHTYGSIGNRQLHSYSIGNHRYGNLGNQQYHSYSIGDRTYGTLGNQSFSSYMIGDRTYIQSGGKTVSCYMVGEHRYCN